VPNSDVTALLSDIISEQEELLWVNDGLNYCPLEIRNCFEKEKLGGRNRGKIYKNYKKDKCLS